MSKTLHARVKEVFFQALDVDPAYRAAFVDQVCAGDRQLQAEVATLLQSHRTGTILAAQQDASPVSRQTAGPAITIDLAPRAGGQTESRRWQGIELVAELPELIEETRQLLRSRLRAFALVLAIALGISLLRPNSGGPGFGFAVDCAAFLVMVLCLGSVHWIARPSLRWLRYLELLMVASIASLIVVLDSWLMLTEAEQNDAVMVASVHERNYFRISILILVYGVFVPNSARRAATILLPVAGLPYLTTLYVCHWSSHVAEILAEVRYGTRVPMPLLAAGTSIYAAYLIHSVRLDLFRARRFAQYRLKRLIGSGGMGVVYEAEHLLLKRPCAVKLIHADQHLDPLALARFELEARATAQLSHPNTVEIYDYGRTDQGVFYYVMELLPGRSLAELVERFGPLPPGRAVYLIRQVCGALQEAHQHGLIHRDIKPANIFASQRGGEWDVAKVLDFGLVRNARAIAAGTGDSQLVGGTPSFMAPEQALPGVTSDARCDIYSLGATLYFLLTGRPPFEIATLADVLAAPTRPQPRPPSHYGNPISSPLDGIVLRCLVPDPSGRFGSAAELGEALAACQAHDPWGAEQAAQWWSTAPASQPDHSA